MVLSEDEAKTIALRYVERMERGSVLMALVEGSTQTHDDGWLFHYQSVEFLETGCDLARLAGNGPVFVHRSGAVHILPTHQSSEQSLALIRSNIART